MIKYIHLNPVRPRDKRKAVPPERKRSLAIYRWSSHRAYAGQERAAVFPGLCLDWLSYFGRMRRAARVEYRRQIGQMFGHVVRSPWEDLRQGLVLGGEAIWSKVRKLLSAREGQEEIRWQRRAEAEEISRAIASLVEGEPDRRVAIWLRVRVGGERMTEVARQYGYGDGSGVHQVVKRLERECRATAPYPRTCRPWPMLCQVSRVDPGSCRPWPMLCQVSRVDPTRLTPQELTPDPDPGSTPHLPGSPRRTPPDRWQNSSTVAKSSATRLGLAMASSPTFIVPRPVGPTN